MTMNSIVTLALHPSLDHLSIEDAAERLKTVAIAVAVHGARGGQLEESSLTRADWPVTPPIAWWNDEASGLLIAEVEGEVGPARAAFHGNRVWWSELLLATAKGLADGSQIPTKGTGGRAYEVTPVLKDGGDA